MRKTTRAGLRRALTYKNPELIARFSKDYGLGKKESLVIFKDMIRFLWISTLVGAREFPMIEGMVIVDEMWHTFILYSREYRVFCKKYFGTFLHHEPTPALLPKGVSFKISPEHRDRNIDLVWKEFGPAVTRRWFAEYPKRYSPRAIKRLQLRALAAAG